MTCPSPLAADDLHGADDADPAGAPAGGGAGARAGHRGGLPLVATADLAVASEDAGFATPGGKAGPAHPDGRSGQERGSRAACGSAMSGDVIDARTALDWGLVNRVVPAAQLDSAVQDLLDRVTRGSAEQGYRQAGAVHADRPGPGQGLRLRRRGHGRVTGRLPDAREWTQAFLEKRKPDLDPRSLQGFSQTETCWPLSLVNGSRIHPSHRSRSRIPVSCIMRHAAAPPRPRHHHRHGRG